MQRCGLEIERVQFESLLQTGPGGYMRRNYYPKRISLEFDV